MEKSKDSQKIGGYMMDDITFCMDDCGVVRCERHPSNIKDRTIPHSYSHFYRSEYCPLEKPKPKFGE